MSKKQNKLPFPLSGGLLVNKPKGITSHDVVAKLRRVFNTKSIGHTGTLDPMAEGLMVILIEKAVKLSQWVTVTEKSYTGKIKFGEVTDTGDADGSVVQSSPLPPDFKIEKLKECAAKLEGLQNIEVPRFSAIKVEGEKLYNKARAGEEFKPPKREMNFIQSKVLELSGAEASFFVRCSKGSYIRSWAVEMGKMAYNAGAHLTFLRRETVGKLKLSEALDIQHLEDFINKEQNTLVDFLKSSSSFISFEKVLDNTEIFYLSESEKFLFSNGQLPFKAKARLNPLVRQSQNTSREKLIRVLSSTQELLGLLSISAQGRVKIQKVFS